MLKLVLPVSYSHTVFTLVVGSYWGNRGDSFYSCVSVRPSVRPSVCLSVRALTTPPIFNIFTRFSACGFFTTQGLHRMSDLEFDPKGQGQRTNQNWVILMICWVQDKSGATLGSLTLRTRWRPWIWPQRSRSVAKICQLWAKATNCWDVDRERRIRGNLSLWMQCRPWIWPQRSSSAARYGQYLAYSMNYTSMTREGRIRGKILLRTWCWPWIWCQRSR